MTDSNETQFDLSTLTHETFYLPHSEPEVIALHECLASADEVWEKLGLAIGASLKAVLKLAPDPRGEGAAQTVYIFDRGPEPRGAVPLVALPEGSDKRSPLIPPDDQSRYVLITGEALARIGECAANDWSYMEQAGWQPMGLGEELILGRTDDSRRFLGRNIPAEIEERHVRIVSRPDGSLSFINSGSEFGTVIHRPAERDRRLDIWGSD